MTYALNTFSLTLHWRDGGAHDMYNVLHFSNDTGSAMTDAVASAITADWRAAIASTGGVTAAWKAYMNENGGLNDQLIKDVTGATSYEFTDNTVVLGTSATDPLPAQTSLLVQCKTAAGGRRARGRIYTGCWSEAVSINTGEPSSTFRADVATVLDNFRIDMESRDCPLVVASQVGTPTNRHITTFVSGSGWRTQRRRAF